jgi:cell division septation protein DedD
MTKENNDNPQTEGKPSPGAGPADHNERHEPRFGSFNDSDEDTYEEPDRDTDYTSGYRADSELDDADFEDSFSDEEADEEDDLFSQEEYDEEFESETESELPDEEQPDNWLDEDSPTDDDDNQGPSFPLGLVAVAIVALVLLAAGGYGVMQERAATQEELRQLRATLATASSPEATSDNREALAEIKQAHEKLLVEAEALTLENRRLTDTIAGLQAQLGTPQEVLANTTASAKPATKPQSEIAALYGETPPAAEETASTQPTTSKPAAPEPAATPPVAPVSSEGWFVNFGSYTSRAVAKSWSTKLEPDAGKVIVAQSTKDGTTYYRVRVIGLASKSAAEEVARQLETDLQVGRLWIGKE